MHIIHQLCACCAQNIAYSLNLTHHLIADMAQRDTPLLKSEGCLLPDDDPLFQRYHDEEWGNPQVTDNIFYEKVCLEGFQSGLSWRTILHRRDAFRELFAGFDMDAVAIFTPTRLENLVKNARIIRNKRKIESALNNAHRAIQLRDEYGSLASFFWQFEPEPTNRPEIVDRAWLATHPYTAESTAMAVALKQRGWTFVGPTNMYALMQALGIVNDHVEGCPRQTEIKVARASFKRPM